MDLLINVDVESLPEAIAFYTSALGLRVGRRFDDSFVELVGAAAPIYLLVKAEGTAPSPSAVETRTYRRHWTPVHLDFVVPDIEAAVLRATTAGARLEQPVSDHAYGKLAVLADPFGHGFCLIQFEGGGYDAIARPSS
jgi:catechol 2,3-dioxygenase-like lactoylglutathione lyase family enzyme